ncbi:hypothetical protein pneo_cds_236 [Pandoravirus neocaledonia]|uniref:Uncharacterized protein n=1 Tax=Pandoravirus neocaledonia TaxID=2107708 RepID=A0A2U7UBM8_9VIRU|nr:hypothetical protein pneo_cds_236 [Pandoravirus neocaledonia]AVK75843.1 hypothetical protein pneo_cds_236 [Pandoravirus neocaledonia]
MQDTAAPTTARRPLAVRKPKATAGWAEREPVPGGPVVGGADGASVPAAASPTATAAPPKPRQPTQGQGKAGPSAAERSVDLRAAYRARMAAMRTSRVGGARRQARNEPEAPKPQQQQDDSAQPATPLAEATLAPGLGLSRSQRKRLARSAKSATVLDAALSRAGVSDPVSRVALANAIADGVGDGTDGAIVERVTRALTK